jgi:hypothetical protein
VPQTSRLGEVHALAARFAQGLAQIEGIAIDPATVETNIVRYRLKEISAGGFSFNRRLCESVATLNGPRAMNIRIPREQQDVALPLVIALSVKMFDVFAQGPPQGALTEENHLA